MLRRLQPWQALGLICLAAAVAAVAGLGGGTVWLVFAMALAAGLLAAFYPWGEAAREGARSIGWLLMILLPLTLPLIAGVIVGSNALSWPLQLVLVPALVVFSWRAIIVPVSAEVRAAVAGFFTRYQESGRGWAAKRLGFLALLLLLVVVASGLAGVGTPFEERPGISTGFLSLAVELWLIAIALRVIGYGTSWPRAAAAGFGLLAVAYGALWAGILPWEDAARWYEEAAEQDWLLPAILAGLLAGLALTVAIEGLAARSAPLAAWLERRRFDPERGLWPRGAGDLAALAAAALLIVAAIASFLEIRADADPTLTAEEPAKAQRFGDLGALGDAELAERFAPVLVFTEDEDWRPIDTAEFLDRAALTGKHVRKRDREALEREGVLPRRCPPAVSPPCFDLTIECERGEDCPEPAGSRKAAYVRVLRKGAGGFGGADPFAVPDGLSGDTRKIAAATTTLVQYWLFYRFNEWTRPTLSGRLAGRHEGDWEAVMVGLSESEPTFVAFSAHCAGAWRPWAGTRGVEVDDTGGGTRTHPLVAVAEGSHANYVETQERRSPDWAGCAGLGEGTTTLLSYASNIRDRTEDGPSWRPSGEELRLVGPSDHPVSFPGTWGAATRTLLINRREHRLEDKKGGPTSPPLKPLWQEPLRTVFCSNWRPRSCGD